MQAYADREVILGGWVRSVRTGKDFGFIDLNDGSCHKGVQVVFEQQFVENFAEVGKLNVGAAIVVRGILEKVKPHQIYAAGDLTDPHGTHRVCVEAVLRAFDRLKDEEWTKECHIWLYRGAWQEWDVAVADMAVPLSPAEMIRKRHAIFRHLSQKDIVPFPGEDSREFWERAEERMQNTAHIFDKIGLPEYQAIELFVKLC